MVLMINLLLVGNGRLENNHWCCLIRVLWFFILIPAFAYGKADIPAACHVSHSISPYFDSVTFIKQGPDWVLMQGVIDSSIVKKVQVILNDPSIKLVVMGFVPGSIDDEANQRAGMFLRKSGISVCLTAKSSVISGGVDFFLAGKQRFVHPKSRLGVHSWQGMSGKQGWEFTAEAVEHERFIAYYQFLGINEDFYWFTLRFPFETVYWLAPGDIYYWSLAEIM